MNDISGLKNVPKDVYDALMTDPMGTMSEIWEGVKNIPGEVLDTGKTIATIKSPEEFFQRNGIRGAKDEKAGQVYFGSGAVSVFPDGRVIITPPNYKDK